MKPGRVFSAIGKQLTLRHACIGGGIISLVFGVAIAIDGDWPGHTRPITHAINDVDDALGHPLLKLAGKTVEIVFGENPLDRGPALLVASDAANDRNLAVAIQRVYDLMPPVVTEKPKRSNSGAPTYTNQDRLGLNRLLTKGAN